MTGAIAAVDACFSLDASFPRHSGLDPESNPCPFMDPGSMPPRRLGDVRDDVCLVLPASPVTSFRA